jgi:tRNA modification GTPase
VIVRLLTPPGRGAIAVVEILGAGALEHVARLVVGRLPEPGAFARVSLQAGDELIDEALCLRHAGDHLELHVHGSPPIVALVLGALGGEAPRRPSSIEEQAGALLPHAASSAAARMLLDQAEGALRRALEDLAGRSAGEVGPLVDEMLARSRVARYLLRPPRVLLAGPTNVGKSTLFNALVGGERAIVSATPGTTRDVLCERVRLGAWAVDLFDAAGERPSDECLGAGELERAGQALARTLAREVDLVVWLEVDAERAACRAGAVTGPTRSCVVLSKSDERDPAAATLALPALSARVDPDGARATITSLVFAALELPRVPWTSGAAVPFSTEIEQALGVLKIEPEAARRAQGLAFLLSR